ncbi:MAG: hypothetical protein IJE83_07040 [Oscillospiraceae bacterium]|nr:hypothetical protein [Oscillospiraceae bacterium]MBQ2998125.1 hypothetical protein [Oscillospiraceae bacterium]MBQ3560714.1 hypothetical protein [Oscillospiraceae bacterium]MBQ4117557.1 hypothetical protein [Oscillospiraceae bacterium]MBQ6802908.1 hypothetical protein [Oscillospiraceae bacterium]
MKEIGKKPRRIALAIFSVIVIIIMWTEKDVLGLWSGLTIEDAVPMVITNLTVTALKIALLAGGIYLIKTVFAKIKKK